GGDQAEVRKVARTSDGVYVVLHTSRVTAERVTVTATSSAIDRTTVASATAKTVPLPQPRVKLQLDGYGKIDFVPTNRPARVVVSATGDAGRLVPLPIEGVYSVTPLGDGVALQAEEHAEGFVSLRFAYRLPSLPADLASTDLVVITEHVQRAVRE